MEIDLDLRRLREFDATARARAAFFGSTRTASGWRLHDSESIIDILQVSGVCGFAAAG